MLQITARAGLAETLQTRSCDAIAFVLVTVNAELKYHVIDNVEFHEEGWLLDVLVSSAIDIRGNAQSSHMLPDTARTS